MGDTGPCGPSSEIFWDLGPDFGPEGGPVTGHDRYIEIWNLVFMTYDQRPDGTRVPLPKPSIDTGAGLERNLLVVQGLTSIWDIDVFRPLIARAERATGARYRESEATDVSLRIIAEHARAMTFIIADGVRPSNQERGYVLRRIIRRAVLHAYLLGAHDLVLPTMIDVAVEVMGAAYPEIVSARGTVSKVVEREEQAFRITLQRGVEMLGDLLERGDVDGPDAFFLHDTLGFPIDLTREIASARGRGVDLDGFAARMAQQRDRARAAADDAGGAAGDNAVWREVLGEVGATEFTGRRETLSKATVVAIVAGGTRVDHAAAGDAVEVVLDRTPFYAESGGQVGDTGTISDRSGTVLDVTDTRYGVPGSVVVHEGTVRQGTLREGDEVEAAIDSVRRDRIRRNHTATHVLHWALREVLGSHVQQAGSLVAPDRLRFDFSHHDAVTAEQLARVERLANEQVISDAPVRHYETTKAEAERMGAIAFFGEKYGEIVRVLEAGPSTELCGGTHVHALGFIGPIKIVSEGSIGSNLRRIEAVTGDGALEYVEQEEELLHRAATLLRAAPKEIPEKIERLSEQVRALQDELQRLKAKAAESVAADLAAGADDGAVVTRRDGLTNDELRRLAQETARALGSGVVALAGTGPDGIKAGIAVAVTPDLVERGVSADAIARPAAKALGGGVGKGADAVVGGGANADGIEEALRLVREQAPTWHK
jgi:alanyl-tRNA synthetase